MIEEPHIRGIQIEAKREPHPLTRPRQRFYVRASVVEAERLPDGRWKVYGPNWLREAEFSDEDFHRNFVQI